MAQLTNHILEDFIFVGMFRWITIGTAAKFMDLMLTPSRRDLNEVRQRLLRFGVAQLTTVRVSAEEKCMINPTCGIVLAKNDLDLFETLDFSWRCHIDKESQVRGFR